MASPASTASRSQDPRGDSGTHAHPSAKPPGEVIAVTTHDDFLLELGETLGGLVSVRPVDSVATALEHLSGSRRMQLLMIDAREQADLRADVDRAHARAPHVPVVVFAPAEAEKTIARTLKSSNVFAVLPIPVDKRKTAAIFEGALADAAEKRGAARAGASVARDSEGRVQSKAPLIPEPAQTLAASADHAAEAHGPRARMMLWSAVIVLTVAVAAGASWYFLKGEGAPPAERSANLARSAAPAQNPSPAVTPQAAPPAALAARAAPGPAAQGTLDELLEKARLAMRERRYTAPASNCALLYYHAALAADPANGEARDGMARLGGLLSTRFDEALAAGRYDEAAEALAGLKVAAPHDAQLAQRESQLLHGEFNAAVASGSTDRAGQLLHQAEQSGAVAPGELAKWRTQLARHQIDARVQRFADMFNQRIRDGHLLEPSDDSAKYYLQQLAQLAPDNAVAARGARDLISACLHRARDAALAGHSSESDKWVTEARAVGMTAADLSAYQRDLATARQRAATAESGRLAQLARDRIQDGHLTDPAGDSSVYYLNQLKSGYGDSSTVQAIGQTLAARLVERAASAARAGQIPQMSSDLTLAQHWGADPALIQAVRQIAGGPSSPAAPAAPAAPTIPASFAPKRIRYQAPEYPERALDARVSGSVTVAYTIDLTGHPVDVRVVQSSPPGVFDQAAIDAVSEWRYEPVVINNVPTDLPRRTVIHFKATGN